MTQPHPNPRVPATTVSRKSAGRCTPCARVVHALCLAVFAAALPLSAAAQEAACPTAADLATGIRATETDGTVHDFTALDGPLVQEDITAPGEDTYRAIFVHGAHLIYLGPPEPDGIAYQEDTEYVIPINDLPIPAPDSTALYRTTVTDIDGPYVQNRFQDWGPMEEARIGACSLRAITGTLTYVSQYDRITETILYLPDLRIGLLTRYAMSGQPDETYDFNALEALP